MADYDDVREPTGERQDVAAAEADTTGAGRGDLGVLRARQHFGGIDIPASLAGMLAALGLAVVLGGILGAIGSIGYQMDVERSTDKLSAGGFIAGLVTLAIAFLVGGWVAGRMARYDGGRNGIMTAVWFVVLAGILAAVGAWAGDKYDLFRNMTVPSWFSDSNATTAAIISAGVGIVVMFLAAWGGGELGERYHRRADDLIAAEHLRTTTAGGYATGDTVRGPATYDLSRGGTRTTAGTGWNRPPRGRTRY